MKAALPFCVNRFKHAWIVAAAAATINERTTQQIYNHFSTKTILKNTPGFFLFTNFWHALISPDSRRVLKA